MKKILLVLTLLLVFSQNANAFEWKFWAKCPHKKASCEACNADTLEKSEVRTFLEALNADSNRHDAKALRKYYAKDFKSYDGFDLETFFKMVEDSFKNYPDIHYSSNIKSIDVYDNWATVALYDTVKATLENGNPELDDPIGDLRGICDYILYLRKEPTGWKIVSDYVIAEETTLMYGEAKKIPMTLSAPMFVKPGVEYDISFNTELPKDVFMLTSLDREPIVYPAAKPKEVFRKVAQDGILERVVRADKDGKNEYTMASVGVTKVYLSDDKSTISVRMSGLGLMLRRVNVQK